MNISIDERNRCSWAVRTFYELTTVELYSMLKLRQEIFIVEQSVPYPDIDDRDLVSKHLLVREGENLVAYMRILPLDIFKPGAVSIGRVVTAASRRGRGIGRELVERGIRIVDESRGRAPIAISSQLYLKAFYESFGFVSQGEAYIEDRIPHIAMIRT